jgi:hypothetical protein
MNDVVSELTEITRVFDSECEKRFNGKELDDIQNSITTLYDYLNREDVVNHPMFCVIEYCILHAISELQKELKRRT